MKPNLYITASCLLPLVAFIAGCDPKNPDNSADASTNAVRNTSGMGGSDANLPNTNDVSSATTNADNSGLNVRDRDTNNLTPGDQGNTATDIDITRNIRKALVGGNYSMTAKNIKIITLNGKVTLRGPVNTDDEKSGIEALATKFAGTGNVDDQLEVKTNP